MSQQAPSILVTGASGQLGQRVLELLLEAQVGTVIATTRNPEKLQSFAERGVIVRYANFDEPDSLVQAFQGADSLLLISTDAVGGNKRSQQHQHAIQAAETAGVGHVVYTSIIEPIDTPVLLSKDHAETEAHLSASKLNYTILRNNIYAEGLLRGLAQAVQSGQLMNAAGDGKTAYISREDCAVAASAALIAHYDGRRILNITGAEALSQSEIVALASRITGKAITYQPLSLETVIQGMVGFGLPQELAEIFASFDTGIAQGIFATVSSDFETLTGKKSTVLAEFLEAHREALIQNVPA